MRSEPLRNSLILVLLFLAAWLPRVAGLDALVTADERKWLARSANFAYALQTGDLAATYQHEHPGVTVMWTGAAGLLQRFPAYAAQAPGYFGWNSEELEPWLRAATAYRPLDLLNAGRWWTTVVVALLIVVAFFPLRRLFGTWLALLALLLIAWMPWAVALGRQLHPDSYLAAFGFVTIVYFLAWLYGGRRRRDLVVAGCMLGLACLTKAPAGFLVSIGLFLVTAHWWLGKRRGGAAARAAAPQGLLAGFVLWVVVAAATFIVLWPALWVNPAGTITRMIGALTEYLAGHTNSNYFMGQIVDDTGPLFYPVAYLLRATPATLLGLGAALVAALRRARPFDDGKVRRATGGLIFYALLFGLLITLPGKKFDRYLLPSFWALEVVAAAGWFALVAFVYRRLNRAAATDDAPAKGRRHATAVVFAGGVALSGLIGMHGFLTALHYPYYLTYFNPLMGGVVTAPYITLIGWGEGLDQVADWLNQQPDAAALHVDGWYADGPLSYYLEGHAIPLLAGSRMPWLDVDYVVLYRNQIQRQLPNPQAVTFLMSKPPVFVASFRGLELARVYDMRAIVAESGATQEPVDYVVAADRHWGGMTLASVRTLREVRPGEVLPIRMAMGGTLDGDYKLSARLISSDGTLVAQRDLPVAPDLAFDLFVPPDAVPGNYRLKTMIYHEDTFEPLAGADGSLETDVVQVTVLSPALDANMVQVQNGGVR